eukprot:15435093-Alexandrium_andersonii.AAC.1
MHPLWPSFDERSSRDLSTPARFVAFLLDLRAGADESALSLAQARKIHAPTALAEFFPDAAARQQARQAQGDLDDFLPRSGLWGLPPKLETQERSRSALADFDEW